MQAGLSQSVRLGQELKINPRLYQAMDMLYMPLLDLQQQLKQELLVNPFLELADDGDDDAEADETEDAADTTGIADAANPDRLEPISGQPEDIRQRVATPRRPRRPPPSAA